jgi:hypothetical protein
VLPMMTLMLVFVAVGIVGVVFLSWFALRLFGVVKEFGREVNRVSAEIAKATGGLQQAADGTPRPNHKPES